MAQLLIGITLLAPTGDVGIGVDGSFNMSITGSYVGGGAVLPHDVYWEWDQGTGNWAIIPPSGGDAGLYTNDPVPLMGKITTDPETITVYGDAPGIFKIRARGYWHRDFYDPESKPYPTVTVTAAASEAIYGPPKIEFTVKRPDVAFVVKEPNIEFTVKRPGITFTVKG